MLQALPALASRLLPPFYQCWPPGCSGHLHPHPFHLSATGNEAVVISGRKLAKQIQQKVWQEVEEWVAVATKGPHLFGENPKVIPVLNKTRAAAKAGINSETIVKPASISEQELLNLVNNQL